MAIAQAKASAGPRTGHKAIEGTLDSKLLEFDLNSEREALQHDEAWSQATGRSSRTLVKHADLRVVLIAMKANTRMHEHAAAGRISVHTLNGHIRMHLPEQVVDLPAGHLLALDQCVPHDVEAIEESTFLLTLSWPPEAVVQKRKSSRRRKVRHANS